MGRLATVLLHGSLRAALRAVPRTLPLALLSVFLTDAGAASAQQLRAFSLAVDNDGLRPLALSGGRTDWYYTHGTRLETVLAWVPFDLRGLGLGSGANRACDDDGKGEPCVVTRVGLSQEIYTPRVHATYAPTCGDRPYAGWLSLSLAAERVAPGGVAFLEVEVGVTGRPSFGREVYQAVHHWLHVVEADGWRHQIPFEVAWAVSFGERWRPAGLRLGGPLSVALEPHWRATLGTLRTGAAAGLSLRTGTSAPAGLTWRGRVAGRPYAVLRVAVEGEAVARDLFLDGPTFGRGPRVEREGLVARVRTAVQVGWRGLGLAFDVTRSTRQFRSQRGSHAFGTVALTVRH